jgi:hypothetical protein
MAIENAKTLNVRIRNKYDSYEAWVASGLVLEAGEIAIAYTTVNVEVGNGKIEKHPELLMKVGNGTDTFSNLPWLSAKAADVAAWAKAANKPTYEAKEITGIDAYISDYVNEQMGISVDTDTQYQIVKVDDYNYKLQSKGKTDEAWADVADSTIVIPNDTAAIEALEDLVGDTKVATQIANAITELDLANTYAAKEHEHTKADITDFAHNHEMSEVNGLADEFAKYQLSGDYATKTEAQGYANAKDEAIAAAKKAGDDAQAYAEGVAGNLATLTGKVGEVPADKTVVQMIADAKTEATYDDTELAGRVGELETLVGDEAVATQISNAFKNEDGSAKYALASELAAEVTTARAAEQANAAAITKLNGDATTAGSVDYKVAQAVAAIMENPDETMNSINELVTWVNDHAEDALEMSNQVTANKNAIAKLNGGAEEDGSVAKQVAAGVTEAKGYTDTEVKKLAEGAVADNATDIAALEKLVGDTAVATQITEAIDGALMVGDGDAKTEKYALATALDATDAEVAKKANDADLADVAKSGLIDDLSIGEGTVLVFDCGSSAV